MRWVWIDPRYADVIAAMRQAEAARRGPETDRRRVRGLFLPSAR
ncbi:hypothetical protein [Streptomyces sp.]